MATVALSLVYGECLGLPYNPACWNVLPERESIMIYLAVANSIIPMHIMESDSIASVKLRIQACKGFFVKKQKLVFGGRELARNSSRLCDYGVADGNILHLVVRLSDIQAITVKTVCGKEFTFRVEKSRNVGYVKQQIVKRGRGVVDLSNQDLVFDGEELEDQRLIRDICKKTDSVIHLLVRRSAKIRAKPVDKDFEVSIEAVDLNNERSDYVIDIQGKALSLGNHLVEEKLLQRDFILEPLVVNPKIELPKVIQDLISSTLEGLKMGHYPVCSSEGSGGAYLMLEASGAEYIAVFKPTDEEPMALNNPQGLPLSTNGEGLKKGTRVGEGALREVAAYMLDHPRSGLQWHMTDRNGFAGVPPTIMVKSLHRGFNHPKGFEYSSKNVKIGSLQMFVKNMGSCEDMGPRDFPVTEVHKISVLDIRLANTDRHVGNILISKNSEDGQLVLIPIDHGYCLPENFEDCTFEWLYWPQARLPYSPDTLDYIKSLDAEQDIKLLKSHGWNLPLECARTFRISTMLLKKGAERGLSPFSIGSIMCRPTLEKESLIEKIVREAQKSEVPGTSEAAFLESVSSVMDRHLDELILEDKVTKL